MSDDGSRKSSSGNCVWYGICERVNLRSKNCVDHNPPRPLNSSGIADLRVWCSHLLPEDYKEGDEVRTCCDNAQLKEFISSFEMAGNIFGRCPSCVANLARHICDFTCSPHHAEFIEVKKVKESKNKSKYD